MNAVIAILIDKLASDGPASKQAAQALMNQARRHGKLLDSEVDKLVPYLSRGKRGIRAAVSRILGRISTEKAIISIARALVTTPETELEKKCSDYDDEPLYSCFISSIQETENKFTAQVLISLMQSSRLSMNARACAMKHLSSFDLEEYNLTWPHNIVEMLSDFASASDPDIAEGAIGLLGELDPSTADNNESNLSLHLPCELLESPLQKKVFLSAWRTETATSIARMMQDSADYSAMPILADALQDAGCEIAEILEHCRGAGTHVQDCWVVNHVLGIEPN